MKTSMTLLDLATELDRQAKAKNDYIAPTNLMSVFAHNDPDNPFSMVLHDIGQYSIGDYAHRQIGEHTGIPFKYYGKMMTEAPSLLVSNVNHWFSASPANRLVRTLDDKIRAYLSNNYRMMDNYDLAEAVLPVLSEAGATVHSADISENKMFIKAVIEGRTQLIPPPLNSGQLNAVPVQPGIVISNSEVGDGAVSVQPAVHTLSCLNMAVWAQHALRRIHLGGKLSEDNDRIKQYLSDQTIELSDAALWSQVRDITNAAMTGSMFDDIVAQLTAARNQGIPGSIVNTVIERVSNRFGIFEGEQGSILGHLIDGGELNKFGLHNAVTRASQDMDSYARATEFEHIGGEIIALPQRDWDALIREVAA